MVSHRPEIGMEAVVEGFRVNYHDVGHGEPVVLLHGSGPGVSAWANWQRVLPALAKAGYRAVAPDIPGFGYSDPIPEFSLDQWLAMTSGLLDHLGIARAHLVGNSFGGALALHLAATDPGRVLRCITMGTAGADFRITPGLDAVWGYEPSLPAMTRLLNLFVADRNLVTPELAELRYRASVQPGAQEAYRAIFPPPRQRWVDALALTREQLAGLRCPLLLVHGRDDRVVPLASSLSILEHVPTAELHVFGRCGHWVQNERYERFMTSTLDFIASPATT